MKTNEVRLLSTEEIKTKLGDARNELMNLRFQVVTGQLTGYNLEPQVHQFIPGVAQFGFNFFCG